MAVHPNQSVSAPRLSTTWQVVISLVLLFHLTALWAGPWSQPLPAPGIALELADGMRPYLDAMYLNHGYRFFAPNPGSSHLVRYTLSFDDGKTVQGEFPNLADQWPRLLYHRYFMLSEHLAQLIPPPDAPPSERKTAAQREVQAIAAGYAQELLRRTGAKEVKLQMVEHLIPDPLEVQKGQTLRDKTLYRELEIGTFRRPEPIPEPKS